MFEEKDGKKLCVIGGKYADEYKVGDVLNYYTVKEGGEGAVQVDYVVAGILKEPMFVSPSILLADEPTGALDNANRDALINLISEINKEGTTVIIVTHDNYIADKCGRKIILSDGKAKEQPKG